MYMYMILLLLLTELDGHVTHIIIGNEFPTLSVKKKIIHYKIPDLREYTDHIFNVNPSG